MGFLVVEYKNVKHGQSKIYVIKVVVKGIL